ncbi:Putative secreted protein OS=Streptomyces glaucescens OX=1907 GN=SGLAU_32815 PE=4 SV=1 [Streptomyces glaucescens]
MPLPLSGALLAPAPASASDCGYEATATVDFRSGPGTGYTSLGLLRAGDRMGDPKKRDGGWWKTFPMDRTKSGIKAGRMGWVKATYLRESVCMNH